MSRRRELFNRRSFLRAVGTGFATLPCLRLLENSFAQAQGAELRQTLGTAVFSGMIGVTLFGLIFTPAFYVVSRWISGLGRRRTAPPKPASQPAE